MIVRRLKRILMDRYKMRLLLPAVAFFLTAFLCSIFLIKNFTGPIHYTSQVNLHESAKGWTSMLASESNLKAFLEKSNTDVNAVLKIFNIEHTGATPTDRDVKALSYIIARDISVAPNRRGDYLTAKINHTSPSAITEFISPYFSFMQGRYYNSWLESYKALEKEISFASTDGAKPEIALPFERLVGMMTSQTMLNGSAILTQPKTTPSRQMSILMITLIAFAIGAFFGGATYLVIRYWHILRVYILDNSFAEPRHET